MVMLMAKRSARFLLLLLLTALAPSAASAVTLQDIIALSRAGVSDPVLLALIDRDKSVFAIEADELVALKGAGVSEAVVIAMLKSGRDPMPPSLAAAPVVDVFPTLVIVGHGPDRPNTFHQFDGFLVPPLPVVPYVVVGSGLVRGARCVGVGVGGTKPTAAGPQLGRLTPELGTRYLASGVGRIVTSTVIPLDGADGTAAPAIVGDCQPQTIPRRSRR